MVNEQLHPHSRELPLLLLLLYRCCCCCGAVVVCLDRVLTPFSASPCSVLDRCCTQNFIVVFVTIDRVHSVWQMLVRTRMEGE